MSKNNTKEAHERRLEIENDFTSRRPKMPDARDDNTSGGYNKIKGAAFPGIYTPEHTETRNIQRDALRDVLITPQPARIKYKHNPRIGKQKVK